MPDSLQDRSNAAGRASVEACINLALANAEAINVRGQHELIPSAETAAALEACDEKVQASMEACLDAGRALFDLSVEHSKTQKGHPKEGSRK